MQNKFFNHASIAVFTSLLIALFNAVTVYIVAENATRDVLIIVSSVTFVFFLGLLYLGLEFFIIDEINKIYTLLVKIKKKDYKLTSKEIIKVNNPLQDIKNEIVTFAVNKEKEITELKKLETFRREFLADVSHELKTPIFAAQGFIHTLIDGAMEDVEVRDKFLSKAAHNLEGLNMLVEDLLTISQLEIGEIKMQYKNFDIHRLAEELIYQLEETAGKRQVRLKFHKNTPKSCYVFADKYRIGQVLTNLLVNAIKYGREKGNVIISFTPEGENVLIKVEDDGPGIESIHLQRIFERFYRVEKSRSKDKGGTGLGLAIVKHILEAHNTRIEVESTVGEGTIFSFRLKKGKVINEKG
ncbi:MAG: sensor histidine kinase [Cytophagaceae bacterium]